jgi:polysaccharide biosynthesis protein PslJ
VSLSREAGTEAEPVRRTRFDAVSLLTLYVLLLVAIPSRLVLSPLGAAGTPAQMLGIGALAWWVAERIALGRVGVGRRTVQKAMLIFSVAVVLSYIAATTRPIEAVELRSADRALLSLCSWLGILLLAADRIPSRDRLDRLLRRVVLAGGALGSLGIVQFFTHKGWIDQIQIPGLVYNTDLFSVDSRDAFSRPAGTAIHPIEFGVVLTMILPIAIHYALTDVGRARVRRWFPVVAIAMAVPVSVSRTAVLGTITVLLFLLPTWPRDLRWRAYGAIVVALSAVYVLVPGLLGTFKGLFFGISGDSSALSRTDSYTTALQFFERSPIIGRGISTFLPAYRILDNQYLGVLIEMGVVGLISVLILFGSGIWTSARIRRVNPDETTRQLSWVLAASTAAGAVSFGTFDLLGFPMATGMVFLVLGCIGALQRLAPVPVAEAAAAESADQSADLVEESVGGQPFHG